MATLHNTLISFQSKIPLSARTSRNHVTANLSFSATFPSIKLAGTTLTRSRGGAVMMSSSAASSYAAALADVARRNNTLDSTAADVEKIENLFSYPDVLDFFVNPTVDIEEKRKFLDDIAKSSGLQPYSVNFLNILIDSRRISLIKEIVKEFEMAYNNLTDTELAIVTSVVKLEPEHLTQIAKQVQKLTGAKNVRIKTAIDPSLVAGFTVSYGNTGSKLIDMSVKKQLEDIASQIDLGDIQLVG
ncbi:ATP synthase delta chain chloroplastic [Tripterygium wilfordii]|uniref:ATP synthase delta chain chloroplastic n=2 Tax=Tripterygium wilfordii TaxID=458696 RepID=A0A7J7DSH5_TRIWF|nr:ATP synthase delta chain chloroplastic [Tripterygium wilfordii]